jgi:hypothetical protein
MKKIDYDRYEVTYLYVKSFTHKQLPVAEKFNHEPVAGQVYKVIKDLKGNTYRMVIDNTMGSSEGIIFDKLIDNNHIWEHEIVELTFENIATTDIPEDEAKKVLEWMSNSGDDEKFIKWALEPQEENIPQKDASTQQIRTVDQNPEFADIMREVMNNFRAIIDGQDGVADVIVDVLNYLRTTYSDKYETDGSPISAKRFSYSREFGTGVNMFCATKYLQRYLTNGFSKSANPTDLLKAIHYILFELARVKITSYVERQRQGNNNGNDQTTEETGGDSTEGSETPKKRTTRKRRKPKG